MFSGKDAANAAYPTQWALNPSAYQNVDSSQVDWAALAQQWIAMKEAAAIVGVPQSKSDAEEGEAPMEVENPDTNTEVPVTQGSDWSGSSNNWDGQWNQWGWGWSGSSQVDPKMSGDPSIAMPPIMDGYPVTDNSTPMQGYTTGSSVSTPTFQHGYWTAPQLESSANNRSSSNRSLDRRSKSRNKESRPSRSRSHRDKPLIIPPVIDAIPMSLPPVSAIDAAKRRQLPAWIREGLEKMEREKQKAIEREQEMKAQAEAEIEKKRLEEEELERLKAEAGGQPMMPAKSKFDTDSEAEESDKEDQVERDATVVSGAADEPEVKFEPEEKPTLIKKSKEEIMQEVMLAVRRTLTEILLEVTDQEIQMVCKEELARYNAAQASRINAMKASKSKALAAITTGLGLGAYESSDDSEEESTDLTDHQLQEIIRRKQKEFERTAREIEAEVRRAESRDVTDDNSSPVSATPERPKFNRSSATPPPVDSETPEKKPARRVSKEKRLSYKSIDRVDNSRKLESIPEEKQKKSIKFEGTPSPQRINKPINNGSTNSSSNDSEDDSSSESGNSSSNSEPETKIDSRLKKKKRRSSSSAESQKKSRKQKKEKSGKTVDRVYSKSKHLEESEKNDKTKSKRKDEYYDKHKSSRSRDERSYRDRYREESDDDRPKKRSKRSRSPSYESRSGRRKVSRDRSEEKSRRRDKRSYDRESTKRERDRSYDRSGRDYDRHDRYERSRDYERRRTRSRSYSRHRR